MANRNRSGNLTLRLDLASLAGLIVAVAGILAGLVLEGGRIRDVSQFSAAVVVFGGTLGAVMMTTPTRALLRALGRFGTVFFERSQSADRAIDEIIEFATQARKNGIVSLEAQADLVADPFLRKALNLAIDGSDINQIRGIMEREIEILERDGEAVAKVYEAAGGYAPTIGIIGAILGLMQVMKNLANIDEVGRGIASAFVATIYGVGSANILFLPAAAKLRARFDAAAHNRELVLDGVLAIVEGLNPKLIRIKLEAYQRDPARTEGPRKDGRQAAGVPVSAEG